MAIEVKGRLGIYRFSMLPALKSCVECGRLTRWEVSIAELGPVCVPVCRRCWGIIGAPPNAISIETLVENLLPLEQVEAAAFKRAKEVSAVLAAKREPVVHELRGESDPAKQARIVSSALNKALSEVN